MASTIRGNDNFDSAYGAALKAFVRFNGSGVVAINSSLNVSSITDNATGSWTVNLTNALTDANAAVVTGAGPIASASITYSLGVESVSSTAVQLLFQGSAGVDTDDSIICVGVFR